MDTTKIEYTAEDLISHKLQRGGILVAKPKFDREGTDLLAFAEMNDGVKFCRIQCKGRTVINSNSYIEIPCDYVTSGFIVFLYVEAGNSNETNLFCFLPTYIKQWTVIEKKYKDEIKKNYHLSIKKLTFPDDLQLYIFNDSKIELIKTVIRLAEDTGEFRDLVEMRGTINIPEWSMEGKE